MATTPSLEQAVGHWRVAADDLLLVARAAAPVPEEDMSGLSLDGVDLSGEAPVLPVAEELDHRVEAFIDSAEAALAELSARAPDGDITEGVPALLGTLEVAATLMQASQDPEDAFTGLGVDAEGSLSLAVPRAALDEFKEAMLGHPVKGAAELPATFVDTAEKLETTGATELIALGQEAILQKAVGQLATGTLNLLGPAVQDAFDWVKGKVQLLRRAAVRLLEWAMEKFRAMIPEQFRDQYDEKVKELAEAVEDGIPGAVANAVGFLAGRRKAAQAWQDQLDAGTDLTAAQAALPGVVSGHVKRIGYVSRGRVVVSGSVAVVRKVTSLTGPQAELVVAAVVAALMGFVWFQLVDGYDDMEGLLTL